MSEQQIGWLILGAFAGFFAVGVIIGIKNEREQERQQAANCAAALKGVSPADSLRIYRVQPRCLP